MRVLAALVVAVTASPSAAADRPVDYARDVLPILSDYCYHCHGPDAKARKADLRLDAADDLFRKDGPLVVPGKSHESELIRRLTTADTDEVMPPPRSKKTLPPRHIATLKAWVDQGAKWGTHWAFTPPVRPTPPAGGLHPVDAFVGAKLAAEKLAFSPPADARTLIRRVTLDLTGLPPTPAEVDSFLFDSAFRGPQAAYERVVDRLLASPRYGERMVWDWLDAARYADTNGYQGDNERTAWPWRDWAVGAFNRDMPFDQFTVQQLAGDLLPSATDEDRLATAFLRNHMINGEGGRIPEENRVDYVMDMAETTGTVWLGLTFNCCRCHDHKFDPVKQTEYYGLFAFFNQTPVTGAGGDAFTKPVLDMATPAQKARQAVANRAVQSAAVTVDALEAKRFPKGASASWPEPITGATAKPAADRPKATVDRLADHFADDKEYHAALVTLSGRLAERDAATRDIPRVMVMADQDKPRDTFVLDKGLYTKPGAKVPAVVPAAVGRLPAGVKADRLALAKWLVSADNPLTARVTVNRLWQQLFGVGMVKTSEDFGVQSERPSHPELLDWLAVEFRQPSAAGAAPWSVKRLLKTIVTSRTYQQSSAVTPALWERDPANRLLARGPRFRLPAWMIRDQALAAAGLLVPTSGGPAVNGYQPPGIWEETTFGTKRYSQDHGDKLYRRSVYTFWRRIVAPTMFFDSATRQTCGVKPARTNTPLHALATLNDTTYVEAARVLAERAIRAGADDEARITHAVTAVLARKPAAGELAVLTASLQRLRTQYAADPAAAAKLVAVGESKRAAAIPAAEHAAFTSLCLVVLNLDEALTKE